MKFCLKLYKQKSFLFCRNRKPISRSGHAGFTLIEVLVAMVLVSMITMIMALAFRLSIQAWERGEKEGENSQVAVVLPSLLEKQLRFAVIRTTFGSEKAQINLDFFGNDENFSFCTLYSPRGTPRQGLVRVTYTFDADNKTLTVYEKLISNKEQATETSLENIEHTGQINKIERFEIQYLSVQALNKNRRDNKLFVINDSSFKNLQDRQKNAALLPAFVLLTFAFEGDVEARQYLFQVAGNL